MRYDESQAALWNLCVQYNERFPVGTNLTLNEQSYSVAFPFNVVSNGVKANLLNTKTHKHKECIVAILSKDGEWQRKL